jgi:hypothetical protein
MQSLRSVVVSGLVVAGSARKRPSPLLCGERRIWAAGVVYAIGRVNFLADPDQKPPGSSSTRASYRRNYRRRHGGKA